MPAWPLPPVSWSRDEDERLILFKIPTKVDLDSPTPSHPKSTLYAGNDPRPSAPTLASLPSEIHYLILDHLPPVDRVCLSLTCKSICRSVLTATPLTPTTWSRFTDARFDYLIPECYQLIQRLAHGWVPKHALRYCLKCHKILSRDPVYWRRLLTCKKLPTWSLKVQLEREEWENLNKRQRYAHLINTWCYADWEDSSVIACDYCQPKLHSDEIMLRYVGSGANRHPVECPLCLERELTFVWQRPQRRVGPWVVDDCVGGVGRGFKVVLDWIWLAILSCCCWLCCPWGWISRWRGG